jgi:UDP-N-acetylmuramate dehydrogenase
MPAERIDMGGYTLTEQASLATLNTLRVAARATLLADIRDAGKLPELLDFPAVRQGRLLVLGEGSNLLFTGDFDGTVPPANAGMTSCVGRWGRATPGWKT